MPQLDVSTYASQIFWLLIAFSTLYYLLSRKGLPRIADVLEARRDRIAADLDQAQHLRAEAEDALATHESHMLEAREQAHALMAETLAKLQSEASARQAELDAELAVQIRDAEERIAETKRSALRELEEVAVVAAQAAIERLIGTKVTKKAALAALREVRPEVREEAA